MFCDFFGLNNIVAPGTGKHRVALPKLNWKRMREGSSGFHFPSGGGFRRTKRLKTGAPPYSGLHSRPQRASLVRIWEKRKQSKHRELSEKCSQEPCSESNSKTAH